MNDKENANNCNNVNIKDKNKDNKLNHQNSNNENQKNKISSKNNDNKNQRINNFINYSNSTTHNRYYSINTSKKTLGNFIKKSSYNNNYDNLNQQNNPCLLQIHDFHKKSQHHF